MWWKPCNNNNIRFGLFMNTYISVCNVGWLLVFTGKRKLPKALKRSVSLLDFRKRFYPTELNAHDMVSSMPNFSRFFCPITNRISNRKKHFPCQKKPKTFLTFRTPHLGSVTRIRSYSNWSSSPNLKNGFCSKSFRKDEPLTSWTLF